MDQKYLKESPDVTPRNVRWCNAERDQHDHGDAFDRGS